MANRKQQRAAAAEESVKDANERAAADAAAADAAKGPKPTARPSGKSRREAAEDDKQAAKNVPMSGVYKVLQEPTRNLPPLIPAPSPVHPRAAKDQSKKLVEQASAVAETIQRQAAFQEAADASRVATAASNREDLLNKAAASEHRKHTAILVATKQKYPNVEDIQKMVPPTFAEVREGLAGKSDEELTDLASTPQQRAGRARSRAIRVSNRVANTAAFSEMQGRGVTDSEGLLRPTSELSSNGEGN